MREIFYMSSCSRGLSHAYTKQSGIFTCFASYLNKHANILHDFLMLWCELNGILRSYGRRILDVQKVILSPCRCSFHYFWIPWLMVQCLFFQWQRAHLLWWPYCGYTKSDCCSQQGHHCLEGYCFTPSDPHQITKARVEKFHKMQRIIQLW